MKKYRFTKDVERGENFESEEILLEYFINDFDKYMLEDYLAEIEAVANGKKTFEEIEEGIFWSFGAEAGYFICDADKAYLKADKDGHHPDAPDVEMPIQELIDILKKRQKFLN